MTTLPIFYTHLIDSHSPGPDASPSRCFQWWPRYYPAAQEQLTLSIRYSVGLDKDSSQGRRESERAGLNQI